MDNLQKSKPQLRRRIRGFDGLRAIAFLLVFTSHKLSADASDRLGSLAVWIFFVLSGFLITRIVTAQNIDMADGKTTFRNALLTFYRHRAFRILPVYYATLIAAAVLTLAGHGDGASAGRQLANTFFVSNFFIEKFGWKGDLGHLWSLAVEQQYYLLFAPLALIVSAAALPAICLMLVLMSATAMVAMIASGEPLVDFDVSSLVNIGLFGIGGFAGLSLHRPLAGCLRSDAAILAVFALLLAVAICLPTPIFSHWGRFLAGPLAGCLLLQIAQSSDTHAVRALEATPLRALGIISYGAYLFHPMIHTDAILRAVGSSIDLAHRWVIVSDLVVTIALATASWRFLERPLIELGRTGLRASRNLTSADRLGG
jgi:peptidoglycan/LPS O-acetylase OafA/YrhL